MDVFGGGWENHFEKIKADWKEKVKAEDVVLIPGDISWAMKLCDALEDLHALKGLPGRKVFTRGNHDYWWNGITKLREAAPDETFFFLQTMCCTLARECFLFFNKKTPPRTSRGGKRSFFVNLCKVGNSLWDTAEVRKIPNRSPANILARAEVRNNRTSARAFLPA